jgi:hypothetical protein
MRRSWSDALYILTNYTIDLSWADGILRIHSHGILKKKESMWQERCKQSVGLPSLDSGCNYMLNISGMKLQVQVEEIDKTNLVHDHC